MISKKPKVCLILNNIRSVHNVGSIFRTAEAAGIEKICCTGTTPTPRDRFNNKRKDFAKVSLGAEDMIGWQYVENAAVLVGKLKDDGYQIIAVEQTKDSVDYRKIRTKDRTAIIVGNEIDGVDKKLLKMSDIVAEIPLRGKKESLNVSVALGIALFRLLED